MNAKPFWYGPGALMLEPSVLALVLVTALNDHWFKAAFAGPITGKLSDFAGLGFFPIVLVSLVEISVAALGSSWRAGERAVGVCLSLTAVGFAAVKSSSLASCVYAESVRAAWHLVGAHPNVVNVVDPTDLLALPVLFLPLWVVRRRRSVLGSSEAPPSAYSPSATLFRRRPSAASDSSSHP